MQSAREIYQAHLDAVSVAFWEKDYNTMLSHILFPSFMETDDELIQMETPDDYRPSLHSFRRKLDRHGATAYHRLCRDAVFAADDPKRIEGVHETFALNGATPVMPPYLNQMTLVERDGRWLGAGIRAAVRNIDWHIIKNPTHTKRSEA